MTYDEMRQPILEIISIIRREHEKQLRPYLEQLYQINAMELPTLRIRADEMGNFNIEVIKLRNEQ